MNVSLLRRLRASAVVVVLVTGSLSAQITESPYTVAPGRLLFEVDGLRLSLDRDGDSTFTGLGVASTLVSAGITSRLDVQAGVDLFLRETVKAGGGRDSSSGVGDLTFRVKWTVWREENSGAALAVIPYVRLPSGTGAVSSDAVEGGLILPWAMNLHGVTAGAMMQWDAVRNDDEDGYDARWRTTGFLRRDLTRTLAAYAESTLLLTSAGASRTAGTIGLGALVQVSKNVQVDYELQRGLGRAGTDWTNVLRVNWGW